MVASKVISMSKNVELDGISVATLGDEKMIDILNLAVLEIHKRFQISTKAEQIMLSKATSIYTLRSTDVMRIKCMYDSKGKELTEYSIDYPEDYEYKLINYNTFLVNKELLDSAVMVVYAAASPMIESMEDEVSFPDMFLEPVLLYISYKVYSAGTLKTNQDLGPQLYARFEASCAKMSEFGYANVSSLVTTSLTSKGFM